MLETYWDQGNPWNDMCPEDSEGPGGNAWAGCVAVAMSQIMKYWEHPSTGSGSYSYTYSDYGLIEADFNISYDWEGMLDTTPTQASSLLLYHAGVSVGMNYGSDGSGAKVGIDCEYLPYDDYASCSWAMETFGYDTCQDVIDDVEGMSETFCSRDAQCGFCEESYMDYTDYPFPNALDAMKQFFGYNPEATFITKEDFEGDDPQIEIYSDDE